MTTSTATQASSAPTDALLSLENVSKIYGDLHALDNVSLEIPRGQWVSIVGPSGSGKTTLMNIVGAMDTATKGTVMLDGHDISDLTADELTEVRCRTIGLVFQQFHLIGHLTALENIMVAQYYHSMPDEKEALEALDRVGLADRATHLPRQLSGGEQQRVCVARALINYPKLVLADEPTGNLDETNEEIVLDLFNQLHQAGGGRARSQDGRTEGPKDRMRGGGHPAGSSIGRSGRGHRTLSFPLRASPSRPGTTRPEARCSKSWSCQVSFTTLP